MADILLEAADQLDERAQHPANTCDASMRRVEEHATAARWLRDVAERHPLSSETIDRNGTEYCCVTEGASQAIRCPDRLSAEAFARVVLGPGKHGANGR